MKALVQTELLKLTTTRTIRLVVLGGLALAGLVGGATAANAGRDGAASLGSAAFVANVVGVSAMPGFVVLIVGVLSMAGEYQHRTITQTLLATPLRGRVVGAKLAAIAVAGVAVAAAMMAVALLAAWPPVLADGAAMELAGADVGRTAVTTLAAGALFGMAGVSLGALFRSQLAPVVAIGAWVVVVEAILGTVLGADAGRWFPGRAASALAGSDVEGLSLGTATALLAGYCLVAAAAATRFTVRRDVS
jgi:ABC-2 type transport system permease protein